MNRFINYIILLAGLTLTFSACLPPKTIGTSGEDAYSEDIGRYRSEYTDSISKAMENSQPSKVRPNPETPNLSATIDTRYAISEEMDDFLRNITNKNQGENTYQGYTVQVYTGSSRERANEAKNRVYSILPEASPTISFDPPNYKVKVGEFTDRLQAQPVYSELKGAFQVVLIVPERFPIVREE